MTRLFDADTLSELVGEPIEVFFGRLDLKLPPTVDAVPVRHGRWIYSNDFHWYVASCNKCGYQRRTDIKAEGWNQWNYCPNCGARMDAE